MQRKLINYLKKWLYGPERKPLILRGARQVGKTWLVRELAKVEKKCLIELNFERNPGLRDLFSSNQPEQILFNIEVAIHQTIDKNNALLFLDEIQTAPEIISKLRWFAEEMPELPVITTGSLLEFVLADYMLSMPVGRINYAHLEPLSFDEYLLANQYEKMYEFLCGYQLNSIIPPSIHQQFMSLFKDYIFIGGMPAAVANWSQNKNLEAIHQLHQDLLATYRDDFAKYANKFSTTRFNEIISGIPTLLSEKFVYRRINSEIQSSTLKSVLDLLVKARICHKVKGCYGNGIPLGAEINEKYFKVIFLDVGLALSILGFQLNQTTSISDINLVNRGGISEQVIGQLLRTIHPYYQEPDLYYWVRDSKGSEAKVDYLIQHNHQIIPVEIKSGSTGTLKSLHLFMKLKNLSTAVRINSEQPTLTVVNTKLYNGDPVSYQLLSIPFYLVSQLHCLLNEVVK